MSRLPLLALGTVLYLGLVAIISAANDLDGWGRFVAQLIGVTIFWFGIELYATLRAKRIFREQIFRSHRKI